MRIFDTHAHYDSHQFDDDRETLLGYIHGDDEKVRKEGFVPVEKIMNIGADMDSSVSTVRLSNEYEYIYAAVGVHPDSAGELVFCKDNGKTEETPVISEESCEKNRETLKKLSEEGKVKAIGEIGLDYHWNVWPRDIQKEAFAWQWKLAVERGLPVIVHSRDAAEDTLKLMKDFYDGEGKKPVRAVMHCYSYSPEHAREYLEMGFMFGIGGVVTFKNAKKLTEVVEMLPLDRILLETDCPYMAPDPFRGKRNNSGYISYIAEKIAAIKGIDVKTVYDCTWDNAERFFGFK